MKKSTIKKYVLILSILVSILKSDITFASHVSGGEITYTSLGGNQYKAVT